MIGEGTTFHILLPSSKSYDTNNYIAESSKSSNISSMVNKKGNILLLDDDKIIQRTLKKIFEQLGQKVMIFEDGKYVIDEYQKAMNSDHPYDLVILDLTIPGGMGGKETADKILEMDPSANLVVSRAGAMTSSELIYFQKKSILIPLSNTPQEHNAGIFQKSNAAIILREDSVTGHDFLIAIDKLLFETAFKKNIEKNLNKLQMKSSENQIMKRILKLTEKK